MSNSEGGGDEILPLDQAPHSPRTEDSSIPESEFDGSEMIAVLSNHWKRVHALRCTRSSS